MESDSNHCINRAVKWEVNESLLQSYRTVFISSQSIFITAITLAEGKHELLNIFIIGIAIFQLLIGCSVIDARALVVDFYKYNLFDSEPLKNYDDKLLNYVTDKDLRKDVNTLISKDFTNWRPTRIKFDIWIPVSFLGIWILLFLEQIWNWFNRVLCSSNTGISNSMVLLIMLTLLVVATVLIAAVAFWEKERRKGRLFFK